MQDGGSVGYKNPLTYQVRTFQKEGEADVRVPFINQEAQAKVPEGFVPKETTAAEPVTAPATADTQKLLGAPTTAKQILAGEKIASAKDILKRPEITTTPDFLSSTGTISARQIIEQETKKQEAKKASETFAREQQMKTMQEEMEFQKKEKEYIKNLDPNNFSLDTNKTYETKFGKFKESDFVAVDPEIYSYRTSGVENKRVPWANQLIINNEGYIFVPEEFLFKGLRVGNELYINGAFLKEDHWDKFLEHSQYIELPEKFIHPEFEKYGNRGFLLKRSDEDRLDLLKTNSWKNFNYKTTKNFAGNSGEVVSLAKHPDYGLVYVTQPKGVSLVSYIHSISNDKDQYGVGFRGEYITYTRTCKGFCKFVGSIPVIGKPLVNLATNVAEAFADIPFGPEIAFAMSGGNPAVYASFAALQSAGQGRPLGDRVIAAAKAYTAASTTLSDISGSISESILKTSGNAVPVGVANAIGGAVVGATFEGVMAAAQGQDVGEAMKMGAIGGGISGSSRQLASTLFGGEDNLINFSKQINFKNPAQLERLITNSVMSGALSAAQGGDFVKAFSQRLVSQGLSTTAANQVTDYLSTNTKFSSETLKQIGSNVNSIVQATARAAIRGEDIDTALKFTLARGTATTGGNILGRQLKEIFASK